MGIIKFLKPQDIFTFANAALGLGSIFFSINSEFQIAAFMLLAAVAMDFLDGKTARLFNKPHPFGKQLDSLADAVTFGAASAVFGYSMMAYDRNSGVLSSLMLVFFVLCGIARLARFNITNIKGYFQGIPITANGIIVPIIYFLGIDSAYYPFIYLVLGILMISSFKVKKIG